MKVFVIGLFTLFGLMGWYASPEPDMVWVQVLVYGLLMINTWFSVRLFFTLIDARDKRQRVMNVFITFAYAFLAWSIRDIQLFYFAWTALFGLASLKFVLLIGRFEHPRLLRRKLVADLFAVLMGLFIVAGLSYVPDLPWSWLGLILFGGACIYYLLLRPLYDTREQV